MLGIFVLRTLWSKPMTSKTSSKPTPITQAPTSSPDGPKVSFPWRVDMDKVKKHNGSFAHFTTAPGASYKPKSSEPR